MLNRTAVELGIRVGLALHCTVQRSTFARKNYFYPDMPKDYQISQYDQPLNVDGWLELPDGTRVGIERAHLEEDTGKSTHLGGDGRIHGAEYSLVDYNRAGVPLVEIVSRPDLRSADDARAYVSELRAILVAIGASDGKMEEGSMRVDANVSVRPVGADRARHCAARSRTSTRCARSVGPSSTRPSARSTLLEAGERVRQETRHWDEDGGPHPRRCASKEEADDYRYFLEPDLVRARPVARVDRRRSRAGLPRAAGRAPARRAGRGGRRGARPTVAIHVDRGLDDLAAGRHRRRRRPGPRAHPRRAQPGRRRGRRRSTRPRFAALVRLEIDGELTATQAKTVLAEMVDTGSSRRRPSPRPTGFEAMDTVRPRGHRRRDHRRQPRRLGRASWPATTRSARS